MSAGWATMMPGSSSTGRAACRVANKRSRNDTIQNTGGSCRRQGAGARGHQPPPTEAHATEVDFVLTRKRDRAALEVKATRTLRPADLRGLHAIRDLDGLRRRVLVYLGQEALVTPDGIEVWPFARLADALAEGTLWP
jgi:hypothetical protein